MGRVIGALIGLLATAVYAVGAAELLQGETGTDVLGPVRAYLPDIVQAWLTRIPLEAAEGAPAWRTVVMSIALGAGIAGGLFLIVRARLSAVMLWLTFLLLLGVFVGQDLGVAGGYETATLEGMIPIAGTLVAALLFAIIANMVTAPPPREEEPARFENADRVRDLIRSDTPPARRRSPFAEPDPEPAPRRADPDEPAPEPAAREPEPQRPAEPPPRPAPPEPTELLQSDDLLPAKS